MVKDVIGDASALCDTLSFVERPVNAEIDSALAVFFFRLGKRQEVTRHVRPDIAIVVFGNAIEFIRDECESDGVGPEESAEGLEERATEASVTGGIGGKWRGKVWCVQIAGWRAQR